jgi:TonB family protein
MNLLSSVTHLFPKDYRNGIGGCMRVMMCGAFLIGSVLSVPVAAQTPVTATPPAASKSPEEKPVRGPRLDSPEIVKLGPGVIPPRLTKKTKPTYPPEVKKAGINGVITMECVVLTDGTVGDVRVKKGLHVDLDLEAVSTVRKWAFSPATLRADGKPVPVMVEIEMQFTLQ